MSTTWHSAGNFAALTGAVARLAYTMNRDADTDAWVETAT